MVSITVFSEGIHVISTKPFSNTNPEISSRESTVGKVLERRRMLGRDNCARGEEGHRMLS
jgi:hypothetical protein